MKQEASSDKIIHLKESADTIIIPIKPEPNYLECMRSMAEAKKMLGKARNKNGLYKDVKVVQKACDMAYKSVLMALDGYIQLNEDIDIKKPENIEQYRSTLAVLNTELLVLLNHTYDTLYLAGYYHGTQSVQTVQNGLKSADEINEYIKGISPLIFQK